MSHDIQAAWAAAELATWLKDNPADCFLKAPSANDISIYAVREPRAVWPITDGVLKIEDKGDPVFEVGIEFKRVNEGLHGVLTALGQAHAYLHRGFAGSVVVIPRQYESHHDPGGYLVKVLEATAPNEPVGVFSYDTPDLLAASPFRGKLRCHRPINLDTETPRPKAIQFARRIETQWAHLREGSSDPSAFFRYLQVAKRLHVEQGTEVISGMPNELWEVSSKLGGSNGALKYLSNAPGDSYHDKVWRQFWFQFVFTREVWPIWKGPKGAAYEVNAAPTRLELPDGTGFKMFFAGRSDSVKDVLVGALNSRKTSEEHAWATYAEKVHDRAHSYREDIDSGLEHLGMLEPDGRPSDLGYRFVDACERSGDCNTGTPRSILGAALLQNGQLGALLHYAHRLSDELFRKQPLAFSELLADKTLDFDQNSFLEWLEGELANRLRVMRKVSARGGTKRKPFQAELAVLRNFGFVQGFRPSLGLEMNWPAIQDALRYPI